MTKICNKCGEEKPATTEYFRKDKRNKDGLMRQCKDCTKEYYKQYRKENKEKLKEYKKQWRQENKEHYLEYNKQYYKENKEYIKEYKKQWSQENKEYIKEYNKQWRQKNKDYIKEYDKQWRKENKEKLKERNKQWRQENKDYMKLYNRQYLKENPDRYRQNNQKRKAIKKRLPHTLTLDQWEKIKNDFNNECAYCGKTEQEHKEEFNEQLHQEHFIPLSEGGEYTHNNIIPACRSCNCSKHNTDFFEWYPTYEHYNEEREQFILEYLGYIEDTQQQAEKERAWKVKKVRHRDCRP